MSDNDQGFIQQKIGPQNGPFKKIGDFKTDLLQKSEASKTNHKIKNYNIIFQTLSAASELELLKNFGKLNIFTEKKIILSHFFFSQK